MLLGIIKKDSGEITWNGQKVERKHVNLGYVADELQEIDSDFVIEIGEDKMKQPLPKALIPLLSKAIQEQQEIIKKLESRINELEKKVNTNE